MPTSEVLIIAHRGASSLAPENTLAAAQRALAVGADMWELDVALTADGVPLLIHDDDLARTSNAAQVFPDRRSWPVHHFTLAEIRRLDFGSWFIEADPAGQIAAGQLSQSELDAYVGEPAPTLAGALHFTRDHEWRANIEIKDLSGKPGNATVVEQVVRLIEGLDMVDRVLISSFNHSYLVRVKAANPRIATAALVDKATDDPAGLLRRLEVQAYHPRADLIQPDRIADLCRRGFGINVWTVNDEAAMHRFIQAGVSGLITDVPQRLKPAAAQAVA